MGKIVAIIVVLIVILGGVWYVMNSGSAAPASPNPAQTTAAADALNNASGTPSGQTAGTIGGLLSMGDVTCTVDMTSASDGSGTVYVSGGKMAGDFSMTANGQTMSAHMINDGSFIYSWSDAAPQGVKMPVPAAGSTNTAPSGQQNFDPSTPVNYSCQPWTVDASKFTPPSSVNFMTLPSAAATSR